MQWYYAQNGSQKGPISEAEMLGKVRSGELGPNDMCWREGMQDWLPISRVESLSIIAAPMGVPNAAEASPYTPPSTVPREYNQSSAHITNYLWQAIVVTVLCCVPFGIPAIIYAAKVDGLVARGEYDAARAASKRAKQWCIAALLSFVVIVIVALLFGAIGAALEQQHLAPSQP